MSHITHSINECAALYELTVAEKRVLTRAAKLLSSKLGSDKLVEAMTSPKAVLSAARTYFTLTHAHKQHEVFSVMYLNNQHHLIEIVDEFNGTIDGAAVYPREIVKQALKLNAAAVIFVHNHPSGEATPSSADINITKKLVSALQTVDIRVLDHIIVGQVSTVSMAEMGLM